MAAWILRHLTGSLPLVYSNKRSLTWQDSMMLRNSVSQQRPRSAARTVGSRTPGARIHREAGAR